MPRLVLWVVVTIGAILVIADAVWRHAQVRSAEAEPVPLSAPALPEGHPAIPEADSSGADPDDGSPGSGAGP